jgi:hypothetical protein
MKYFFLITVSTILFLSCGPKKERLHHSVYFLNNNSGARLTVKTTLATTKADLYCSTCIIEPGVEYQLVSNITSSGSMEPAETIDRIDIYRNDSLKYRLEDSTLNNFPWGITKLGDYNTNFELVINPF